MLLTGSLPGGQSGAQVVLYDNGKLYQTLLQTFPAVKPRISSHTASQTQYSFWGNSLHECLFSTRELTPDEKIEHPGKSMLTWVQLENSSINSLWDVSQHAVDFLVYLATGKNVGPMGLSSYTEKRPCVMS